MEGQTLRFIEQGIDFPDDLLRQHDRRDTVIVCGAGVSRAKANIPDFDGLTQQVLENLGALPESEAHRLFELSRTLSYDEKVSGVSTSDRVFQLLYEDFSKRQVTSAVSSALKPEDGVDLLAHQIILDLARQPSGGFRLVTTNFDRLFETSKPRLNSLVRSSLPQLALSGDEWGLVHIHGRVDATYHSPDVDGFVLASSEFGDAYLSHGWAADFMRELLSRYTTIFIGFKAEDPPIRYLLEGLQYLPGSKRKHYAFQDENDDQAISAWYAKGVEVITYPTSQQNGHDALWDSLAAWSRRSLSPSRWTTAQLKKAQKGPRSLKPHERGIVAHIVSSKEGAAAFSGHNPIQPAEWLCVFDATIRYGKPGPENGLFTDQNEIDPFDVYRLDSDPFPAKDNPYGPSRDRIPASAWSAISGAATDLQDLTESEISQIALPSPSALPRLPSRTASLARWIARVYYQPAAPWWVGRQEAIHPELLNHITYNLRRPGAGKRPVKNVTRAWQLIRLYHRFSNSLISNYPSELYDKEWDFDTQFVYAQYFSPSIKSNSYLGSPLPPEARSGSGKKAIVNFSTEYPEHFGTIEIPKAALSNLLRLLTPKIELAEFLETVLTGDFDFFGQIPSISPPIKVNENEGSETDRDYGFSGFVLRYAKLVQETNNYDPDFVRHLVTSWPEDSSVFSALSLWARGYLRVGDPDQFAELLLSFKTERFWPSRGERDILVGLSNRWNSISPQLRKKLERRLIRGRPPSKRFRHELEAVWQAESALNRLQWLKENGCAFSFDVTKKIKELTKIAQDWSPTDAERNIRERYSWSGWVKENPNWENYNALDDEAILEQIEHDRDKVRERLIDNKPFLGLSRDNPKRAINVLSASKLPLETNAKYWEVFLSHAARQDDADPEITYHILKELLRIDEELTDKICRSIAYWMSDHADQVIWGHPVNFDRLFRKVVHSLHRSPEQNMSALVRQKEKPDWPDESINSPTGKLADLILSNSKQKKYKRGQTFDKRWKRLLEYLLTFEGDALCFALFEFGRRLPWLEYVDENWVFQDLSLLTKYRDESPRAHNALLTGVLWSSFLISPRGFEAIRNDLIQMTRDHSYSRSNREAPQIAIMLFLAWCGRYLGKGPFFSDEEFRRILYESSPEFPRIFIHQLERQTERDPELADDVLRFLIHVWPRQNKLRTRENAVALLDLTINQKNRFPEFVDAVITRTEGMIVDDTLFYRLRDDDFFIARNFPAELLRFLAISIPIDIPQRPYYLSDVLTRIEENHPELKKSAHFRQLSNLGR